MSKKLLILVGHPGFVAKAGFNYQVFLNFVNGVDAAGGEYMVADLFESEKVMSANFIKSFDGLVFIFPNWCEMPPAVVVSWIQRHMSQDIGYTRNENGEKICNFEGLKALVLVSQGTPDVKDYIVGSMKEALGYCGISTEFLFFPGVGSTINFEEAMTSATSIGYSFTSKL